MLMVACRWPQMLTTAAPLLLLASAQAAVQRLVGDHTKAFAIISEDSNVTLMGSTKADVLVTSAEFEAAEFYITGMDMNLSAALAKIVTLEANDAAKEAEITALQEANATSNAKIAALEADNNQLKAQMEHVLKTIAPITSPPVSPPSSPPVSPLPPSLPPPSLPTPGLPPPPPIIWSEHFSSGTSGWRLNYWASLTSAVIVADSPAGMSGPALKHVRGEQNGGSLYDTGRILDAGQRYHITARFYGTVVGQMAQLWVDKGSDSCGWSSAIHNWVTIGITNIDQWLEIHGSFEANQCESVRIHLHEDTPIDVGGGGWKTPIDVGGSTFWDSIEITLDASP